MAYKADKILAFLLEISNYENIPIKIKEISIRHVGIISENRTIEIQYFNPNSNQTIVIIDGEIINTDIKILETKLNHRIKLDIDLNCFKI